MLRDWRRTLLCSTPFLLWFVALNAHAHGVSGADAAFIESTTGFAFFEFLYLGAKHMVTGYDHLLFLFGVIFFLYKLKDVSLYVSLFTIGHSLTLLAGVLGGIQANAFIVDAIIGISVIYKGFDNLGGFKQIFNYQPNTKIVVLIFGLFHGFGLATKLQEFTLSEEGLVANILSFNLGVELGQILVLSFMIILLTFWRMKPSFGKMSYVTNTALIIGGFMLMEYQLMGYLLGM
jgi:hypothetical protein